MSNLRLLQQGQVVRKNLYHSENLNWAAQKLDWAAYDSPATAWT